MKPKTISPFLANGEIRDRLYGRLPPAVKDGLRKIARSENKSMSWVIEEMIIDYFHLNTPLYKNHIRLVKGNKKRA